MRQVRSWIGYGAIFAAVITSGPRAISAEPESPAQIALESIFSPARAPAKRTMGLLQRSFLDLVESSQPQLQVALVVDGTDSMGSDMQGVRNALNSMVTDLRRYRGDDVSFALVVYRDLAAESGEVTVPLREFTNDVKVLEQAFDDLKPESGAPYFPELADLGVHRALDALPWSEDAETTRWLLVFGDAPPYDPDFRDDTGARRRYDTDLLVNLAKRREVQINCILCTSRESEKSAYDKTLDKTRGFMNSLASGSGGLMLDLSYPDIRSALVDTAKKPRLVHQRIGKISREDIENRRKMAEDEKTNVAASKRLKLAVLPHAPLEHMTFDPDDEAVQIATELRQKFRTIPRAEVKSPVDVERAWRYVKASNLPQDELLQALAVRLRVDYVVWGSHRRAQGIVQVKSSLYSKADGEKAVDASVLTSATVSETELAGNLANKLLLTASEQRKAPELTAAYLAFRQGTERATELLVTPVANNAQARGDLLAGLEALEQALAFGSGTDDGTDLLERANRSLTKATDEDPRNPFVHMLQASCSFNRAQLLAQEGKGQEAQEAIQEFSEALKRAYRERDNTRDDYIKNEIQADYQLLIKKDYEEAIRLYEQLSSSKGVNKLHTALRAHWMLAGIFSGDWGVDQSFVDMPRARKHLIEILAHWETSSEAAFVKRHLRWDDDKGENQFEHFPRPHEKTLAGLF